MRYININNIVLPEGWLEKVQILNDSLNQADTTNDERKRIINDNPIWKELFVPLSNLSKGKCWYSETLNVMSDKDIDHFRPKGEAKNIDGILRTDEDGYWWLAYDYENYRFSSQYCNQLRKDKFNSDKETRGKWVFFPLFEGSVVAKSKRRCDDEEIMLLDPCDENDPPLLTFESKGKAVPNASALLEPRDKIRVETSIKIYHLDHSPLEELRERFWDFCQRMIDEIRKISTDPEGVSNFGRSRVKFLKDEIKKLTSREVELSAVAIACCEHNGLHVLTERR
jgi:hypothetical protein